MFAAIYIRSGDAPALAALAREFSPHVEMLHPGTAVFAVEPLRRLFGDWHGIAAEIARRGHQRRMNGNIGMARDPDTAVLAARQIPGVTVIPPGHERRVLGRLEIATLPLANDAIDTLHRWGVHTLDEFCRLPEAGVVERLGSAGLQLWRIARGEGGRPLRSTAPEVRFDDRTPLEHPVGLLEPLLFLLARVLNELCGRLKAHSRATTLIRLTLELENRSTHTRTLQLPFATRDAKALLKLLQLDLEAHPPADAITAFTLALDPVAPRMVQNDLYTPPAPEPEKLELTLGKIRAMVGVDNAGCPEALNTHRPDAWRMRPAPAGRQSLVADEGAALILRLAFPLFPAGAGGACGGDCRRASHAGAGVVRGG